MWKCDLNKGCSLVNFLHIFRMPFPKNTSGEMPLKFSEKWYHKYKIKLRRYLDCSTYGKKLNYTKPVNQTNTLPLVTL